MKSCGRRAKRDLEMKLEQQVHTHNTEQLKLQLELQQLQQKDRGTCFAGYDSAVGNVCAPPEYTLFVTWHFLRTCDSDLRP